MRETPTRAIRFAHLGWCLAVASVGCAYADPGSPTDGGAVSSDGAPARLDAALADGGPGGAQDRDAAILDAGVPQDASVPVDAGPPPPACPRARITTASGLSLNVRPEPSTTRAAVASLPSGYIVDVVDMVRGEAIDGEDLWFEIASPLGDGFVFATYAECTEDERPADDGSYVSPRLTPS